MRMSHIYQPVMLMTLLRNEGRASVDQVAGEFLVQDESQVEYYSHITKVMQGRVIGKKTTASWRRSTTNTSYEALTL